MNPNYDVNPNFSTKALDIWTEKLSYFESELSLESDAEKKFKLTKKIEECEHNINRIKQNILDTRVNNLESFSVSKDIIIGSIPFWKKEENIFASNARE